MSISEEKKLIARSALHAFGGKPTVSKYWDDAKESHIDLLSTPNRPYEGVSCYSTIGVSDFSIGYTSENTELRVELVGACAEEYECFPNILATCAFFIMNSKYSCSPGEVFRDVVRMYNPDCQMEHILFVPPFLWEDSLRTIEFPDKKVTWLLAVPISECECGFAKKHGTDALERLFEEKGIDIFDLERDSVL